MSQSLPETVIIIPSRYGSERLPHKPLAMIAGRMLVERVYERCRRTTGVSRVIVATDHDAIADAVRGFGGEVVLTSPDCPSGTDRIAEAARTLGLTDEIVINVQGDEPLIEPEVIQAVIDVLRRDATRQVATAVTSLTKPGDLLSPSVVKAVLATDGAALYFSRAAIPFYRDHAKNPELWTNSGRYYKHLGIYGYRKPALDRFVALGESSLERIERLEQLRFLEAGIRIYAAHVEHDSVAVDTKEDIRAVELLLVEKGLS